MSRRVMNSVDSTPFIASLFCGSGKPPDLEEYLEPFLLKMQELIQDGRFHKETHSEVRLTDGACDAPARSFVKRITSHSLYNSYMTVASSHNDFIRGLSKGLKQPSRMGQRLIVAQIGREDGFLDGCLDVFRGQNTGDYPEEMDGTRFER
ncbi:hypothetical protein HPB47_018219 [Ixodes persulcatus]|uniref:Uncharacterized protein n=1 Tax=Ixodes persulcatus TaxID=34615 RepID=A0AC60QLB5_IXOPE|nr:hypothetical protein HPB47_018219 [Ixodes persulcatus]